MIYIDNQLVIKTMNCYVSMYVPVTIFVVESEKYAYFTHDARVNKTLQIWPKS